MPIRDMTSHNDSEGEIDTRTARLFCFRDLMLPVVLRYTSHQKQTTMRQIHFGFLLRIKFVLELKTARGSKTYGGNDGIFA
jgi:hypothetical protein